MDIERQTPILTEIISVRELRAEWARQGLKVALVPTMGNLHAGHLSLVRLAQAQADRVVVSIFVNPLQFGPTEDFAHYPRTLAQDVAACTAVGVDAVFSPSTRLMHPTLKEYVQVRVPGLSDQLCGQSRPGFFYGVATVVTKLFNLTQPDVAVFGEKDYQQYLVIERLVQELQYPIRLILAPIVREVDGLAMSSRNGYLSPQERALAPTLYQQLQVIKGQIKAGKEPVAACQEAGHVLSAQGFSMDYLVPWPNPQDPKKLLLACWLGKTRLIDNISL